MVRLSLICGLFFLSSSVGAQKILTGIVRDATSGEALYSVTLNIFQGGALSGGMTNREGKFQLSLPPSFDSLRLSMVGYAPLVLLAKDLTENTFLSLALNRSATELGEVTVKPLSATDIVNKAIAALPSLIKKTPFENKGFYRELIRDKDHYFSLSEALFLAQYYPDKKRLVMKAERGRTREDVSYTRLFEDYHPSGGPQLLASQELVTSRPDFLDPKKTNSFVYTRLKMTARDGHQVYRIAFDQKQDVKESLEAGTLYIDADDFAVLEYEAHNSERGMPYIKNLTGTDKVFAQILHIDFKRKGWQRHVFFSQSGDRYILNHADEQLRIGYKQPNKQIDLDLTIDIELAMTDLDKPLVKPISREEEWKKNSLAINLPTAYDSAFWGNNNIITPTEQVNRIMAGMANTSGDSLRYAAVAGWQYLNQNLFLTREQQDSLILRPLMKSRWEDEDAGGLLYRTIDSNFAVETRISLQKSSASSLAPDRGFQQGGIMIRNDKADKENYFLLSLGTGGSATPKLFFKKTENSKSKTVSFHEPSMMGWLRLVKSGKKITAYFKEEESGEWQKTGEYESDWLQGRIQVGLIVFAHFPGSGPKMTPDMMAIFSSWKIQAI